MTQRREATEDYKVAYRQLDDHAVAIGHVCFAWAELESDLNQMFTMLTLLNQQGDAAEVVSLNIDMRQKIEIVKALAFVKKSSDEWFNELLAVLNEIDNGLRPERNRNIHDYWLVHHPSRGETTRHSARARLRKADRGQHVLTTYEQTQIAATQIWDLVHAIRNAGERLHHLWHDYGRAIGLIGGKAI